jgi:plastocyanin
VEVICSRPSRFEVLFDSVGAFGHHCSQHVGMTGTIIVQ